MKDSPVGFVGVEQAADSAVSELDEAECGALDPLREVLDATGRPARPV